VGDLTGDGDVDLVMSLSSSGLVLVFLQHPNEDFSSRPPDYIIDVGGDISSLVLADLNGDGRPDIVATDQLSGEIHVLVNSAVDPFSTQLTFRAGDGLAGLTDVNGAARLQSSDAPVAVVAGRFFGGPLPDLAVLDSNADRVYLLENDGKGGLYNPGVSFATGLDPVAMVSADFNCDGIPDLAVLNKGSGDLTILLGNGQGGFTEQLSTDLNGRLGRPSAGNNPTGLATADINGDGRVELLVSNPEGDVLTLVGNGDGTFEPYRRLDRHVALAVGDDNGDGQPEFVLADQARDQVTVEYAGPGTGWLQDRQDGILAPNAVRLVDLNGDGIPDLVVANGGGNDVLVYLGLGDGTFGPARSFFAGTDPAAVAVADLNGDGVADLVVANQGSNDVSVLFGQGRGSNWTLTEGPRLRAGLGPTAVTVADVYGDGTPDILVANGQSNDAYLLRGVGGGFFDDKHPVVFRTGADPTAVFVGRFGDGDGLGLVTLNAGSGDLSYFAGFGPGREIGSGGVGPVAAVAGDFTGDGRTDLVVANVDGEVSLFLAGADGPRLAATLTLAGAGELSDAALGAVGSNSVDVYLSTQEGGVVEVSFALDLSPALSPAAGGAGTAVPSADFSPLLGSSLGAVATLLLGGPPEVVTEPGAIDEVREAVLVSTSAETGGGDLSGEAEEDDGKGAEQAWAEAAGEGGAALNVFVLGLEDAAALLLGALERAPEAPAGSGVGSDGFAWPAAGDWSAPGWSADGEVLEQISRSLLQSFPEAAGRGGEQVAPAGGMAQEVPVAIEAPPAEEALPADATVPVSATAPVRPPAESAPVAPAPQGAGQVRAPISRRWPALGALATHALFLCGLHREPRGEKSSTPETKRNGNRQ
jgi:hypothetical protein